MSFDTIKLESIGFAGGLRSHITEAEKVRLEQRGLQLAISEAMKAPLTPDMQGLATRDIMPDLEFQDKNDVAVGARNWRQPWSGHYEAVSGEYEIYRTNKSTDYDKKILAIWGVRYVNTGPGRLGNIVSTGAITFKDSAGNTYDTWDVQGLDINYELYSFTPIIFGNSRQLRVFHHCYPPKTSGSFDNIQFLGAVCERRGDNVNGLQRPEILSTS